MVKKRLILTYMRFMMFLSAKIGIFLKTLGWQGEESVGRAPIFNVYLEKNTRIRWAR
jgi:hypothetical protein